jgi:hypothetical protein
MQEYLIDMDVCSMYAWAPLVIKQSLICKILKQCHRGKSHSAKIQAKRRLKLYKNAWIEYDTQESREWTKARISILEFPAKPNVFDTTVNLLAAHLKNIPEKGLKECLNQTFGPITSQK